MIQRAREPTMVDLVVGTTNRLLVFEAARPRASAIALPIVLRPSSCSTAFRPVFGRAELRPPSVRQRRRSSTTRPSHRWHLWHPHAGLGDYIFLFILFLGRRPSSRNSRRHDQLLQHARGSLVGHTKGGQAKVAVNLVRG